MQHWGLVLGIREGVYGKLNLHGSIFYDTYTIIIDLFCKKYESRPYLSDSKIIKCLNRKILKKIIMTVNYNAGKRLSHTYLIDILKEEDLHDGGGNYKNFIEDFHNFLNDELFSEFFQERKNSFLEKNRCNVHIGESDINLVYLKVKEVKEVVKIKNIR